MKSAALTLNTMDETYEVKYETLNDRILKLEKKTDSKFPYHLFLNALFIDEASVGFSETGIEPYSQYPRCLKSIGMGIGELVVKDIRGENDAVQKLSYSINLLEWEGLVSYNGGKKEHWYILTKMFIPYLNRVVGEYPKRTTIYVCEQSKYFIDKISEEEKRENFIKLNGTKNGDTYEQELKEWVGKEVKMRLWANLDDGTIDVLLDKKRRPIERLHSIRDKDFLCSCFSECGEYLIHS